jgi:ATP-dependent Clp protease ATP-binding subunit ClpC
LEDGHLTDGHGRTVDFSNTVVITTSNVGAEQMTKENRLGFNVTTDDEKRVLEKLHKENRAAGEKRLREIMRPELLNRFDQIITFDSLSRSEVSSILDLIIDDLNKRLASKGVGVTIGAGARRYLVDKGYNPAFGARPMRRLVQDELENQIAEKLIRKEINRGDILRAIIKNDQLEVIKVKEKAATEA